MPPKAAPKRGKENVVPKRAAKEVAAEDDFDTMDDASPVKPTRKVGRPPKVAKVDTVEDGDFSRSASDDLTKTRAENERLKKERDAFAKQFEELSRLRTSEPEALFEKFKTRTEEKAKAQAAVIESQTKLYEKQSAKVEALEQALAATQAALEKIEQSAKPPNFDAKIEGMGSKELREEIYKLRDASKAKDGELEQVRKEYQAEVAHSRKLQESTSRPGSKAPVAVPTTSAEQLQTMRLYEDLTGLDVLSAVITKHPKLGEQRTFKCIQTVGQRNYGFKLRLFNEFDRDRQVWEKQAELLPTDISSETDKAFLKRLGPFVDGFAIPRSQLVEAWKQLVSRMSPEGDFVEPGRA